MGAGQGVPPSRWRPRRLQAPRGAAAGARRAVALPPLSPQRAYRASRSSRAPRASRAFRAYLSTLSVYYISADVAEPAATASAGLATERPPLHLRPRRGV